MAGLNVVLGGQRGPSGPPIDGIVVDATTARTLVLTDAQKLVRMTSASANDVTVPPNSSVPFLVRTQIGVEQDGAGLTSIVAGVGVTIRKRYSLKAAGQYAVMTLIKVDTDEWLLVGDTADI